MEYECEIKKYNSSRTCDGQDFLALNMDINPELRIRGICTWIGIPALRRISVGSSNAIETRR